jgi:hypothetical protein
MRSAGHGANPAGTEDQADYVGIGNCFCRNRGFCRLAHYAQLAPKFSPFATSINYLALDRICPIPQVKIGAETV